MGVREAQEDRKCGVLQGITRHFRALLAVSVTLFLQQINRLLIFIHAKHDAIQPATPTQKIFLDVAAREKKDDCLDIHIEDSKLDGVAKGFDVSCRRCKGLRKPRFYVDADRFCNGARKQAEARTGIDRSVDRNRLLANSYVTGKKIPSTLDGYW